MNREPVLSIAGLLAAVSAVITVLVAFGLDLTEAQSTAVLGAVAALAPLVAALVARRRVTPVTDPRNNAGVELFPVAPDTAERR